MLGAIWPLNIWLLCVVLRFVVYRRLPLVVVAIIVVIVVIFIFKPFISSLLVLIVVVRGDNFGERLVTYINQYILSCEKTEK